MSDEAVNETLRQLSAQLGRVEGTLDGIEREQARTNGMLSGLAERVGDLEKTKAGILAVAGIVSAAVAFLAGWLRSLWGGAS